MQALWIWLGAALLYGLFRLWYDGRRRPLSAEEIEHFLAALRGTPGAAVNDEDTLRRFLSADDGREFYMLNLVRLGPAPVPHPETGAPTSTGRLLREYRNRYPRVSIHLEERTPERVWEMLARGRLSAAFTRPAVAPREPVQPLRSKARRFALIGAAAAAIVVITGGGLAVGTLTASTGEAGAESAPTEVATGAPTTPDQPTTTPVSAPAAARIGTSMNSESLHPPWSGMNSRIAPSAVKPLSAARVTRARARSSPVRLASSKNSRCAASALCEGRAKGSCAPLRYGIASLVTSGRLPRRN